MQRENGIQNRIYDPIKHFCSIVLLITNMLTKYYNQQERTYCHRDTIKRQCLSNTNGTNCETNNTKKNNSSNNNKEK